MQTILVGRKRHKLLLNNVDAARLLKLIATQGGCLAISDKGYPRYQKKTNRRLKVSRLHRMIAEWAGLGTTHQIDHKNHNKLDCRRRNLRRATHSQQQCNRGLRKDNTSGYKGVSKNHKRYMAAINKRYIGTFSTAKEAARAYDKAARRLHGSFARLNFPRR